jgi:hypothetical protein
MKVVSFDNTLHAYEYYSEKKQSDYKMVTLHRVIESVHMEELMS